MTSVAGISRSSSVAADRAARRERLRRDAAPSSGRALIPITPIAPSERPAHTHADARFIAHLIATDQKLPQTRERRRAEPRVAITAYGAANAAPAAPPGPRLFRVM